MQVSVGIGPLASSLQIHKEEHFLDEVFRRKGYPTSFIRFFFLHANRNRKIETNLNAKEKPPLILIPYALGVSEDIRRVCQCQSRIQVWLIIMVYSHKG